MAHFPERVRLMYRHNKRSGLYAAVSDDLPGLMTVGRSLEEVDQRAPAAIAQLVQAQYGASVVVVVADGDDDDRFRPLDEPRLAELRAA